MAEFDITKKITKALNNLDRLVQAALTVKKSFEEIKDSLKKSKDKPEGE